MVYFCTKNPQFCYILEGLGLEIFVYFTAIRHIFAAIWYMVWPCCIFCCRLVYFSNFGVL
jgi:hypothetical protein